MRIRGPKKISLFNLMSAALFIQMLLLPRTYMWVKCIFLAIILFTVLMETHFRLSINKGQMLILLYVSWNFFEILLGTLRGYGNTAFRMGTVDILWPLAFVVFASKGLKEVQLRWIYKCIIICTAVFNIYDILLIAGTAVGNNTILHLLSFLQDGVPIAIISNGAMAYRTNHLNYYAFVAPFMLALLFEGKRNVYEVSGLKSCFVLPTAILSIVLVQVAGLGGIILACAAGFFFCILYYNVFLKGKKCVFAISLLTIFLTVFIYSYSQGGVAFYVWKDVTARVDGGSYDSLNGDKRIKQVSSMLDAWMDSPLFGNGTGYPVSFISRGESRLTADNEMSYFEILYQKGIVGIFLFGALIVHCIKISKIKEVRWFMRPFMIGALSYLCANAFNPYLTNLSNYWILFLPFCIDVDSIKESVRETQ